MKVEAYLFFNGQCDEAIAFYQSALGAQVEMLMRFHEMPEPHEPGMIPEGMEEKVMHASLLIGETRVMASDGNCNESAKFDGFSLSLQVETKEHANKLFNALAEEGTVIMPIGETFWSPHFGMVTDKFGMGWMIDMLQEG